AAFPGPGDGRYINNFNRNYNNFRGGYGNNNANARGRGFNRGGYQQTQQQKRSCLSLLKFPCANLVVDGQYYKFGFVCGDRNGVGVAGDNSRELLIEPARNLALYRKTVEGGAVSQHSEESLESIHPTNGLEPGAMADYFRSPAFYWYLIILPALGINFLAYYSPNLLRTYVPLIGSMAAYIGTNYHWITVYTNVFALVAHIGESLYACISFVVLSKLVCADLPPRIPIS
ncbi:hypothetical protein OSTOST_11253, partial [Ostertagia ostertagi]